MPTENIMYPCSVCQKQTVHIKKRINHILHLLLSVLFIGLWLIVWIGIAVLGTRTPVCTVCGNGSTNNIITPEPKKEVTNEDVKNYARFVMYSIIGMALIVLYFSEVWKKIPILKDILN